MPSTGSGHRQVMGDKKNNSRGSQGAPKMKETIKMQSQDELKYRLSPIDEQLLESVFHHRGSQTIVEIMKIKDQENCVHQLSLGTNMASCVTSFPYAVNSRILLLVLKKNVFEASVFKRTDMKASEVTLCFCQMQNRMSSPLRVVDASYGFTKDSMWLGHTDWGETMGGIFDV